MIDLFYPTFPHNMRRGRVVNLLTPVEELPPKRGGRDPVKAQARQARYRAKMALDEARHAKHLAQCRQWHQEHREEAIARMKARRAIAKAAK